MNIAFYAPLKSPAHPTPSGDRQIARNIMEALRLAGHDVELASELRTYEGRGDQEQQIEFMHSGKRNAIDYIEAVKSGNRSQPHLWFTYHVYHKAPDWIGPHVAAALDIPYVIAEGSLSPKQAEGKWKHGYDANKHAINCADLILGLNPRDKACVEPHLKPTAFYEHLPPFIDTRLYRNAGAQKKNLRAQFQHQEAKDTCWLLTVGMMRNGDKYTSYAQLADALEQLADVPWHLFVVGDGPAQEEVRTRFATLSGQITWLGEIAPDDMPNIYAAMDILSWPAVNEAIGLVFLEAGAAGLPVIAGHTDGVASIVRQGQTGVVVPTGDSGAFAAGLRELITNTQMRTQLGNRAEKHVREHHSIESASSKLNTLLRSLTNKEAA